MFCDEMNARSYYSTRKSLRDGYELLRMFEKEIKDKNEDIHVLARIKREIRASGRYYKRNIIGNQSIRDAWHTYCSDDGEHRVDYRILTGEWTDEEIDELVDDLTIEIHSPYDCTGKLFTGCINTTRVANGLAVVHHMYLDV